MREHLLAMIQKASWVPGTVCAFAMPWAKVAESAVTLITSVMVSLVTFFLTRWLNRRFPPQVVRKKAHDENEGSE